MSDNGVSCSALRLNQEQFQRLMLIPVDQQPPVAGLLPVRDVVLCWEVHCLEIKIPAVFNVCVCGSGHLWHGVCWGCSVQSHRRKTFSVKCEQVTAVCAFLRRPFLRHHVRYSPGCPDPDSSVAKAAIPLTISTLGHAGRIPPASFFKLFPVL